MAKHLSLFSVLLPWSDRPARMSGANRPWRHVFVTTERAPITGALADRTPRHDKALGGQPDMEPL